MAARFETATFKPSKTRPFGAGPFAGFTKGGKWTGHVELIPEKLDEPLHWRKPRRVFVNSMSDLFHEALPASAIDRVFAVMADARHHTFQILTKRPERMLAYLRGGPQPAIGGWCKGNHKQFVPGQTYNEWPLPNVWLGVSVEDQKTADERIPLLLDTPAAGRFVSYEPALGPVRFEDNLRRGDVCRGRSWLRRIWRREETAWESRLEWVIVGGESGPGARPFDAAWARSVRDQCKAAGVACFVKQMGARIVGDHAGFNVCRWYLDDGRVFVPPIIGARVGQRPANAVSFSLGSAKGGDMAEWPADLRVREFPR
jgi:protein gp37